MSGIQNNLLRVRSTVKKKKRKLSNNFCCLTEREYKNVFNENNALKIENEKLKAEKSKGMEKKLKMLSEDI